MDEMKVKLSTKFMRGVVAKLLSMMIRKKFGCNVDIKLHDLDIRYLDGDAQINTSVEVKLSGDDFMKLIKQAGLEE